MLYSELEKTRPKLAALAKNRALESKFPLTDITPNTKLGGMFSWSRTPEGGEFWNFISSKKFTEAFKIHPHLDEHSSGSTIDAMLGGSSSLRTSDTDTPPLTERKTYSVTLKGKEYKYMDIEGALEICRLVYTEGTKITSTMDSVATIVNPDIYTREYEADAYIYDRKSLCCLFEMHKEGDKKHKWAKIENYSSSSSKFDLDSYTSKGDIKGFPKEVIAKMLERQYEQTGSKDVTIFEGNKDADHKSGGMTWSDTSEGLSFWNRIINNKNFDLFFERYPNSDTDDLPSNEDFEKDAAKEQSITTTIDGKPVEVTMSNLLEVCNKKYPEGTKYICAANNKYEGRSSSIKAKFLDSSSLLEARVEVGTGYCYCEGKFAEIVEEAEKEPFKGIRKGDIVVSLKDYGHSTRKIGDLFKVLDVNSRFISYKDREGMSLSNEKPREWRKATQEEIDYYYAYKENETGTPNISGIKHEPVSQINFKEGDIIVSLGNVGDDIRLRGDILRVTDTDGEKLGYKTRMGTITRSHSNNFRKATEIETQYYDLCKVRDPEYIPNIEDEYFKPPHVGSGLVYTPTHTIHIKDPTDTYVDRSLPSYLDASTMSTISSPNFEELCNKEVEDKKKEDSSIEISTFKVKSRKRKKK